MQQFDSFAQMQRDAAMRVMEMQKRAQAAMRNPAEPPAVPDMAGIPAINDSSDSDPLFEPAPANEVIQPADPEPGEPSDEEAEKALITAILLLLMREKADERLLFALLYILM